VGKLFCSHLVGTFFTAASTSGLGCSTVGGQISFSVENDGSCRAYRALSGQSMSVDGTCSTEVFQSGNYQMKESRTSLAILRLDNDGLVVTNTYQLVAFLIGTTSIRAACCATPGAQ
jgi:hypothetical protein